MTCISISTSAREGVKGGGGGCVTFGGGGGGR